MLAGTIQTRKTTRMSDSGNHPLASALAAQLQHSLSGRSLSGVVRSELATIEAALRHGIRYEQLCQLLAALGIHASVSTLRQTVYRLRRQQPGAALANSAGTSGETGGATGQTSEAARFTGLREASRATATVDRGADVGAAADAVVPGSSAHRIESPQPAGADPRVPHADRVPLLPGDPATPATSRSKVDFITEIRTSYPDLDQLADRYRKSLQRDRLSQATAAAAKARSDGTPSDTPSTPDSTRSTPP